MGAAQQAPRGWIWVMDLSAPRSTKGAPVLHPARDQKDVRLSYGRGLTDLVGAEGKRIVFALEYGPFAALLGWTLGRRRR